MQRARILRSGISTVRKRCVVSGVELRASRLAWTHPRHKSTQAEPEDSLKEPPRVRAPAPGNKFKQPRANRAESAKIASKILRGGSGTVLEGILSRIEGRRQRLERLAQQSILYKNPFNGVYTAGHVFTPGLWHQNLEPGDLVCCGKQKDFGVVVNVYNAGFTLKVVILTVTRSLQIVNQNAASFCIKHFVPRKVAEACLVPLTLDMSDVLLTSGNVYVDQTAKRASLSSDEVPVWIAPIQIAEQVCKIIRHFQTEAMALNASLMPMAEEIHRELSAQDESKIMSLFDIADYIRPRVTFDPKAINVFYFAVHTLISEDTIRWQAGSSVGFRHLEFAATSRTRVEQVERGIEYVRDINGEVARSFIEKCVKLIKYYRKFNKSDPAEINAAEQPHTTFSDSDQAIIRTIMLHLSLYASSGENQKIFSLVGRLLREIDMWGDSVAFEASTARQLLYEIGVLPRWVDLRSINVLDGREVADLSQIVYKKDKNLGGGAMRGEGMPKLELKDRMEKFRHDFGDLPVYCVDGPGAEEIDDGISIEAAEDGATWVHVHIANPTAFFHKDDEIITRAASRWETIYLNEGSRPLLPAEVIAASGLRRPEGEAEDSPRPVLTFSIKLDANVEIIDYAVRPSHVRNIKSVTYGDLSEAMNWDYSLGDYGFPQQYELPYVDNTGRNTGTARVLSESDKQSLQLGFEVAEKVRIRRARAGAQTRPSNHLGIAVNEDIRTVFGLMETTPSEPSYEFPTPDANMRVYRDVYPASYVVSEFMLLAGRVATMYAAERNIQLPFRHGLIASSEKLVPEDYTRAGFLKLIYPKSFNPTNTWYDIEPGPSADLGLLEGYARVTSPLRRYLDMVAHFQLEASIRGEDPVYTRDELEKLIKGYLKFQASGKILKRGERDWRMRYLDQLKQQGGLKLTVIVMSNCLYPEHTPGFNIDYGIPVFISCDRRLDLKIGDYIVCDEVEESDPLLGRPIVKAPSELTPKTRYEFAE
ncbi:hypothetical protein BZA70DRAFT_277529 [Myxozyma melibiosi]|uniref:RNB domain-containing protein n=1 Tax=Myxozyma melibiosi TaxID=54550 RepID=A0ABR1F806_9ASCO